MMTAEQRPYSDAVRHALAVSLRGCDELLIEADWAAKLARSEKTGQPIGFGLSIVRQLAHIVDAIICYIGYLFPLWDAKRQTLADKIMTTVCLPL